MIHLSLTLFNTSWGIYSTPKKSKETAVFLIIINETQSVPLFSLSSRFMTYAPSLFLVNYLLKKKKKKKKKNETKGLNWNTQ